MTGSEIARHDNGKAAALAVPIRDVNDLLDIGRILSISGFFKNTQGEEQAAAKILAGMELGISPVASLRGLYIVEGQISLAYPLLGALIKKSGKYDYRIREKTAEACVVEFFESGESVGFESLTMKQAKERGLDKTKGGAIKDPWAKFPENMLLSKCLSNGAKAYTSEVFYGSVYTPDELGAEVDGATGAVVELEVLPGIEYSQCEGERDGKACGALIRDHEYEDGRVMSAAKIEEGTRAAYGKALCWDCAQKAKAAKAEADKAAQRAVEQEQEEYRNKPLSKRETEVLAEAGGLNLKIQAAGEAMQERNQGSAAKALTSARTRYNVVAAYATSLGMKAPEHKASHNASQLEEMIRSLSAEVIDAINAVALINESVPDEAIPNDSATFEDWTAFVAAYGLMEAIKAEIASLEESEDLEEEAAY